MTIQSFDSRAFRDVLGGFCTGVTVVSGLLPDGRKTGLTVNSFCSVSLDPPLVSFNLDRVMTSLPAFRPAAPFAVIILAEDQQNWSQHFASVQTDKWAKVPHRLAANGCAILGDALAVIEGRVVANYDGGDHVIVMGRVEAMVRDFDKRPLVYFGGGYAQLV